MGSVLAGLRGSVLLVCTANVCRSPLAAAMLAEALPGAEVTSAGVQALDGAPMCDVSASRLPEGARPVHVARQLTGALVDDADLVITLEREQRSAAIRLAPGSQGKVFTLREAAALGRGLVHRDATMPADVRALAHALHGVRGLVLVPSVEPPRRRWWRRAAEPADPLTVVDGHGRSAQLHAAAVREVASAVQEVVDALEELRVPDAAEASDD